MYSSYASFIKRAEIRIFEQKQSLQAVPLKIIAVDDAGLAKWHPTAEILARRHANSSTCCAPMIRRAISTKRTRGRCAIPRAIAGNVAASDGPSARELLAAYGENDLARQQIPLGSGTVKVQGSGIPAGHTVWVAGRQIPVDPQGNFAAEEILPAGAHSVEVSVLDDAGNGSLYLRDLEFKRTDLFYVGIADLTVSKKQRERAGKAAGRRECSTSYDSTLDGRLAFYLNGNVHQNWRLTASADTREGPVKDCSATSWASRPIRYSGASIPTIITRRSATTV